MDSLSNLTFLSMNCGGVACKATDIIATLTDLVVELWEGFEVSELEGMGYKVCYAGVAERGAGMAIMVTYAFVPRPSAGKEATGPEPVQSCADVQKFFLATPNGHRITGCNV